MEKVLYKKGAVGGIVRLPPSKSVAHRALICAALSHSDCVLSSVDNSADMQATFQFMRAMGVGVSYNAEEKLVRVTGGEVPGQADVNCLESGSTLRFVIPIMAALGVSCTFTGQGRLPQRPIGLYNTILRGVTCVGNGLPFTICGQLESGEFTLPGNISSQFITGLLLALPLLGGDSKIILSTKLESESYVNLTLETMAAFGVTAKRTDYGYFVPGGQQYLGRDYTVEGDWSQAAFFLSMAAFSPEAIELHGLNFSSSQGDRRCLEVFSAMGVHIERREESLIAQKPLGLLRAVEVDAGDIPDMVPAIAMTAALAVGDTVIRNAGRLRLKESDRIKSVCEAVKAIGGIARETANGLVITGVKSLSGGAVNGYNDHRIVMSLAAAAAVTQAPIAVSDPWSIRKSYPNFFSDYVNLGGVADVIKLG